MCGKLARPLKKRREQWSLRRTKKAAGLKKGARVAEKRNRVQKHFRGGFTFTLQIQRGGSTITYGLGITLGKRERGGIEKRGSYKDIGAASTV